MSIESDSPNSQEEPSPTALQAAKQTYDDIALRAYFIALDRHARGELADPRKDWLEAEQQLS